MRAWIFAMLGAFAFSGLGVITSIDNGCCLSEINAVASTALIISLILGGVGLFALMVGSN